MKLPTRLWSRKVPQSPKPLNGKVAFITGAAHRIGAHITRTLHTEGMDLALHFRHSTAAAKSLKDELEASRPDSVLLLQEDLHRIDRLPKLLGKIERWRNRLDLLVNNASNFYPTPLESATEDQWDDLVTVNLKAPFFLARHAAPLLRAHAGAIVNLVDIHAERPLKDHPIYSIAKAGNAMMVKALARELGPEVRVTGVAPGAILWPETEMSDDAKREILARTALKRPGSPDDIARAVLFLVRDAEYITGQILAVDGGRSTQQ
jgi:pteridine reductase